MGISATTLKFILHCAHEYKVDFSRTVTLGRQRMLINSRHRCLRKLLTV